MSGTYQRVPETDSQYNDRIAGAANRSVIVEQQARLDVAVDDTPKKQPRTVDDDAAALVALEHPNVRRLQEAKDKEAKDREAKDVKEVRADSKDTKVDGQDEDFGYDSDLDDTNAERTKKRELDAMGDAMRAQFVGNQALAAHRARFPTDKDLAEVDENNAAPVPITLTWRNVHYVLNVDDAKSTTSWGAIPPPPPEKSEHAALLKKDEAPKEPEHKVVLSDVSGYCRPGTFTAILGSSGAGKTSLLNILSGRVEPQPPSVVALNGLENALARSLLHHTAFVEQTDMFFSKLTVREHLETQARLRLPSSVSDARRAAIVTKVINSVGLTHVAESGNEIGGNGMGLSGGERRRLTFATELLTNPSLLLLDEPTSGLDSTMAGDVLHQLRILANEGRTIVCTVHQPDEHVFALFDKVIIMAEGHVAYFGPSQYLRKYMGGPMGHPVDKDSDDTVVSQFIRHVSIGSKGNSLEQVLQLCDTYKASKLYKRMEKKRQGHTKRLKAANDLIFDTLTAHDPTYKYDPDAVLHRSSWCTQFRALSERSWISLKRDKGYLGQRLIQQIVVNVILGLIALRIPNTQAHITNKLGALFFIMWNTTFSSVWSVSVVFPPEMPLFVREYKAGLYRADTFFLARNVVELPAQILFPLIYGSVSYWMCGFNDNGLSYLKYIFSLCYAANAAASLGYVIACIGGVRSTADITPLILFPFLICGGLILATASIPSAFRWLVDISVFHDAYELMSISVFKGMEIECPTAATCLYPTGEAVLAMPTLNFSVSHLPLILVRMLLYFIIFRTAAFIILVMRGRARTTNKG